MYRLSGEVNGEFPKEELIFTFKYKLNGRLKKKSFKYLGAFMFYKWEKDKIITEIKQDIGLFCIDMGLEYSLNVDRYIHNTLSEFITKYLELLAKAKVYSYADDTPDKHYVNKPVKILKGLWK